MTLGAKPSPSDRVQPPLVTIEPSDPDEPTPAEEQQAEKIAAIVLARIDQRIEHLHMPMAVPDARQAAALKEQAPEVYEMWLDLVRKRADDESAMQRASVDHPLELAKRGQWFGLAAMVALLLFCGYLASFGGAARLDRRHRRRL